MADTKNLQKSLDSALNEFCLSISDLCNRLANGANFSDADVVKAIGNETAKCLADYKEAIIKTVNEI